MDNNKRIHRIIISIIIGLFLFAAGFGIGRLMSEEPLHSSEDQVFIIENDLDDLQDVPLEPENISEPHEDTAPTSSLEPHLQGILSNTRTVSHLVRNIVENSEEDLKALALQVEEVVKNFETLAEEVVRNLSPVVEDLNALQRSLLQDTQKENTSETPSAP